MCVLPTPTCPPGLHSLTRQRGRRILVIFSPFVTLFMSTSMSIATGMCSLHSLVRNGCSLLTAIGSVLQERTSPMAAYGTMMWSILLDLPWSAKKVLPMSCHVVATAKKLSCAVFLISLRFLWWSPFSARSHRLRLSSTIAWFVCHGCRRCSRPSCITF